MLERGIEQEAQGAREDQAGRGGDEQKDERNGEAGGMRTQERQHPRERPWRYEAPAPGGSSAHGRLIG